MVGRVVSIKMNQTVVVLIESKKSHPLYKKTYTRTKKFLAHDLQGAKLGDIVVIEKVRPISKRKHHQVIKVLGQDFVSLEEAQLQEKATQAIAEVMPEEKEKTESSESSYQKEEKRVKKESKLKKEKTDS